MIQLITDAVHAGIEGTSDLRLLKVGKKLVRTFEDSTSVYVCSDNYLNKGER